MPTVGLVLTLAAPHDVACAELRSLFDTDPRITPGPRSGPRLPLVVETTSVEEDRDVLLALGALHTVLAVDLTFVDFSDISHFDRRALRGLLRHRPSASCGPQDTCVS